MRVQGRRMTLKRRMTRRNGGKVRLVGLVAGVMAAGLGGCGIDEGKPGAFSDQDLDVGEDEQIEPAEGLGEGPGAGTMTGTWLKVHAASSCVLNQEQVSYAYYLVEFEEDGLGLREQKRLCGLDLSPLLGFRPVASEGVLESVEFVEVDRGMVTRLVPGGVYASATEVGLWGLALEDPLNEDVPADPEDGRVVDRDEDGNPGVSLDLEGSGCARFMGQRQVVRYFGEFEAPNDIRGRSATRTDMEVYGATAGICELAPQVVPNDGESEFRMVRIDGQGGAVDADENEDGVIECEEIGPWIEAVWERREADGGLCGG